MSASKDAAEDFATMRDDLLALKTDVMRLASSLGNSATEKTRNVTGTIDDSARQLYGSVAEQGSRAAKSVVDKVDEQPVMALLIAAGVGFVCAKLMAR